MMSNRRYDRSTIESLLAERARNRWSLGELSRRSGVPTGTPSTWAARAQRAEANPSAAGAGFAEVVLTDALAEGAVATVVLRHASGWTVDLRGAAATTVAVKLVEALTRCCSACRAISGSSSRAPLST